MLAITAEIARIAELSVTDARRVAANAARKLHRVERAGSGRARALVADLEQTIRTVEQVIAQTNQRISGQTPDGSERIVSLHDLEARPVRKAKLSSPVEFGYTAQVVDNPDGIVIDHDVTAGNPPDARRLVPAIERIITRFGRAPRAVTADRGYGEAKVENQLAELGVGRVAIPRKGRPGAARIQVQRARPFVRLIKWRTGSEGRISHLKHSYGWDRTRLDGLTGTQTWCGFGILAHNAVKISGLIEDKQQHPHRQRDQKRPPQPTATGPPTSDTTTA